MQKLNKLLAAFLAILIAVSIFPLPTNSDASLESSVTFVPVSPYNEFDVKVNGTGDIITIYCLQQKYRWPKDEEHVIYYDKDDATSDFSYKNLLTDEEVEILRKLVYAGYPNDSQGILRKYYLEGEWGAEFTNQAIWSLMAEWNKPGSDPSSKLDYNNIDETDFAAIVAAELINYAKTAPDIVLPTSTDILIEGDFTLNENPDGTYSTGYLMITHPVGLNLLFDLGLPSGVKAIDEFGFEITQIGEYENFKLVADTREDIEGASLNASATLNYPGEVSFFVTKQDPHIWNQVDHVWQSYQTMLYVPGESMDLSRTFSLVAGAQETVEVKGQKIWDDNNDQDGKRPGSITIRLHENGVEIDSKVVTAADGWEWEWTNLPKYKAGSEVVYSVSEDEVTDYTTTKYGSYSFINHYTPGETSLSVEKIWNDDNNRDGIRPSYVIVKLLANGVATGDTLTITITAEGNWEGIFTGLPEKSGGVDIVYTIEEIAVPGYSTVITGDQHSGYVITNTHTPETVSFSGHKIWDDNNNQDGVRPSSIHIHLLANGAMVEALDVTAADNWEWSWSNLPKYDNGVEIIYSVTEGEVENYTTVYDHDSNNIINKYTPGKVSVSVSKAWYDNNNQDGIRPANVTVFLYADHVYTGKHVVLDDENNWEATFTDLDEYKEGVKISYSVMELPVDGYHGIISGSEEDGFIIANSHIPETINIEGNKIWDDNNNASGNRPSEIIVRLRANGTEISSATITEADGWGWSWTNLPKYENGNIINYTITEDTVFNYSAHYDNFNIINSYTPGLTSISVEKSWHDNNNQDGIRPENIIVKLFENGVDSGKTLVLSDSNNWEGSFDDLEVYKNQQLVTYSIAEVSVDGYYTTISGSASTGFIIVNVHEPETVSVSGNKVWNDNNDQDGKRPASIIVRLHANGAEIAHKVISATDNWSWEFLNLPKNENGSPINYTVSEDAVDEYSTEYVDNKIINTYTPGKVSVSVSKTWNDHNNQDGKRPAYVVVTLFKNGTNTGISLVLNDNNNWADSFKDLDEYENGVKIVYEVKENDVPGYVSALTGNAQIGFTFTNSHTPEKIDVFGVKTWDDHNNQDGNRPSSIIVRLYADGLEIGHKTIGSGDNWSWIFEDLPKYNNGSLIHYTVTEDAVDGYSASYDGFDITNHYTPGKTSVSVEKRWLDANNQDGIRPSNVVIKLFADGIFTGKTLVLSYSNLWSGTFADLDEKAAGVKITYTVEEETVSGYSDEITGDAEHGFVITNTHVPETVNISGSKTWNDNNNQDGKRPSTITIRLHANGNEVSHKVVSSSENWSWQWNDMPKYENGTIITYTISEDAVNEYSTEYHDFNVTNTYTPGKVSISVNKIWDDNNNQDGKRPEDITVTLIKNGVETDNKVVLSDVNNWQASFGDLDEYENGIKIVYTVKENDVNGYSSVISGSALVGYTFTNTHTPETTTVTGTKTWDDNDNQDGKRPQSITIRLHANGTEVAHVEVDSACNWKWIFEDLPLYNAGTLITYTVSEDSVEDYGTHYDGYNVINKYTPGKTSVTVEKIWSDNNNQDGIRPGSVTIKLFADGVDTGKTLVLDASNQWSDSFDELDEYKNGVKIVYSISEDTNVPGYSSVISGSQDHGFIVINTHEPETAVIHGTKTWNDNNNQDGIRPGSITVRLLADNLEVAHIVVSAADNWEWNFDNMPKYKDGNEIFYSVLEDTVEFYSAEYSGYDIINNYTPGVVSVNVNKLWHDANNQDGIRPAYVKILLLADGTLTGDELILNESNHWSGSFDGLDEYANGVKIEYSVIEENIQDYNVSINKNSDYNFTVINSYVPSTVSIDVTKTWDDGNDHDGLRPQNIVVNLYEDGEFITSIILGVDSGWDYQFENLPEFKNGTPIVYNVTENPVEGYDSEVTGSAAGGFIITNKHVPVITGDIVVSKTVNGNLGSTTFEFDFTITLGDTTINGIYGDMTFVNGVASFKLKHGESKIATALPQGISYVVEESNNDGYIVTKTGDTGTVPGDDVAYVEFVNTKNGNPETGDHANMLLSAAMFVVTALVFVSIFKNSDIRKKY